MGINVSMEDIKAEYDKLQRVRYEERKTDLCEFSNWFEVAKTWGFRVPETVYFKIDFDRWNWLHSDNYSKEEINKFDREIRDAVKDFNLDRKLFIKSGLFSNKFVFDFCKVENGLKENLGEKMLNINYGAMCVGCNISDTVVIREFIETSYERPTIYFGMKLNTEFRVFYDFDKNDVILVVNYWSNDKMLGSLTDHTYTDADGNVGICYDRTEYMKVSEEIENDYQSLKGKLIEEIRDKKISGLHGKWSIDFMWTGSEFVLIDMAVAEKSAYYNMIKERDIE